LKNNDIEKLIELFVQFDYESYYIKTIPLVENNEKIIQFLISLYDSEKNNTIKNQLFMIFKEYNGEYNKKNNNIETIFNRWITVQTNEYYRYVPGGKRYKEFYDILIKNHSLMDIFFKKLNYIAKENWTGIISSYLLQLIVEEKPIVYILSNKVALSFIVNSHYENQLFQKIKNEKDFFTYLDFVLDIITSDDFFHIDNLIKNTNLFLCANKEFISIDFFNNLYLLLKDREVSECFREKVILSTLIKNYEQLTSSLTFSMRQFFDFTIPLMEKL